MMLLVLGSASGTRTRSALALLAVLIVAGVVVVATPLATLFKQNVLGIFAEAKGKKAEQDIGAINQAVTNYALRNGGTFPATLKDLITPDSNGNRYLARDSIPEDPWDNEYLYDPPIGGKRHRVYTYGRDGLPGGPLDDGDFDSTMLPKE